MKVPGRGTGQIRQAPKSLPGRMREKFPVLPSGRFFAATKRGGMHISGSACPLYDPILPMTHDKA